MNRSKVIGPMVSISNRIISMSRGSPWSGDGGMMLAGRGAMLTTAIVALVQPLAILAGPDGRRLLALTGAHAGIGAAQVPTFVG